MTGNRLESARLSPDQVAHISQLVAEYISTQRERYGTRAAPLTLKQAGATSPFFTPELLVSTRVLVLRSERLSNPDFYPTVRKLGFENLPDQRTMAAITFCDVVVSHETFTDHLLFHELVHVEQYKQLGIERFAELYVRGFLEGGSYEAIPLEINAYTLEDRFRRQPHRVFSVREEVRSWLSDNKF